VYRFGIETKLKALFVVIYKLIGKKTPLPIIEKMIQVQTEQIYQGFFEKNLISNLGYVEKEVNRLSNIYKIPYKFNKDVFLNIKGTSLLSSNSTWTTGYTQQQINRLKKVVAQSLYNMTPEADVKERLMTEFGYSSRKAGLIARREVLTTRNSAVDMIWEEDNKEIYDKVWVTMGDDIVRDSHIAMNGKIADPVTGLFQTTWGEQLSYPGSGYDAKNNINCRCHIELRKREKA